MLPIYEHVTHPDIIGGGYIERKCVTGSCIGGTSVAVFRGIVVENVNVLCPAYVKIVGSIVHIDRVC